MNGKLGCSLLVLLLEVWCTQSLALSTIVGVTSALQIHFRSGCVYLTSLNDHDMALTKSLAQLQVQMAEKYIASGALNAANFHRLLKNFICHHNRAIVVILCTGDYIHRYLQQIFSSRFDVSKPRWLLLVDNSTMDVKKMLGAMNIPFNCEFLLGLQSRQSISALQLSELYRVTPSLPFQMSPWGNWSLRDGLTPPSLSLYERRSNLQGITFSAAAFHVKSSPWHLHHHHHAHVHFLTQEVFGEKHKHNRSTLEGVSVQRAAGNSGGTLQNNGSWSGVTGMILAKRVNMTVNDFYITVSRTQVVDYTIPVLESRYCIYIRTPDSSDARWEAIIKPFRSSLWLAIGCCILVTVFFFVATHTFEKNVRGSKCRYNTWQALLNVWGSFCSQGTSHPPTLWSARLVHWASLVTGMVLLAAYSGNFISFLTVPRIHLPFTDLQGILHDDSYTFLVKAKSTLFRNFQDANNTIMKEVYRRKLLVIKDSLPPTIMDAFHRMCKQRSAFMVDCGYMRDYRKKIPCSFSHLPDGSFRVVLAFMLPKRSPYKGVLDHRLQQMIRSGLVRRLYLALLADTEIIEDKQQAKSVELQATVPLLALVCMGIVTTIMILLFEVYIGHRRKNMRV